MHDITDLNFALINYDMKEIESEYNLINVLVCPHQPITAIFLTYPSSKVSMYVCNQQPLILYNALYVAYLQIANNRFWIVKRQFIEPLTGLIKSHYFAKRRHTRRQNQHHIVRSLIRIFHGGFKI